MENMWIKKEEWDNYKECMQKLDAIWWRHTGSKVFSKETFENIPVIVVSSLGEEEGTVIEAFNLGADDFVSKPFNPNELLLRVKRLFAKKNYSIKPKELEVSISA